MRRRIGVIYNLSSSFFLKEAVISDLDKAKANCCQCHPKCSQIGRKNMCFLFHHICMLAFMFRDDDDSGDDGDCDDDATDQFCNGGVSSVVPWEYICPLKYICTNKRCIFQVLKYI